MILIRFPFGVLGVKRTPTTLLRSGVLLAPLLGCRCVLLDGFPRSSCSLFSLSFTSLNQSGVAPYIPKRVHTYIYILSNSVQNVISISAIFILCIFLICNQISVIIYLYISSSLFLFVSLFLSIYTCTYINIYIYIDICV